jgi:hypothetical protein
MVGLDGETGGQGRLPPIERATPFVFVLQTHRLVDPGSQGHRQPVHLQRMVHVCMMCPSRVAGRDS